ncbi:MAG: FAD:protein FMN transferase [Selenomonadaceae bacterium]|nr:FAD:protein FMN transferase [Selenomonadaceae bacterium]
MKNFFTLMILLTTVLLTGCTSTVERTEIFMGTVVTLKANGLNAQAAVDESFHAIAELERNISADVAKIEAADAFVDVSPDVYKILETAQIFSELTNGAFDVTVGAAVDLWAVGTDKPRVPTSDELAAVKNFVGHERLHLRGGKVHLDSGVKLNLGGIGKGYGVDIVRKIFASHNITDGLIDFGTSTIFAVGRKKIGIKNPREVDKLSAVVEIENSALSTSGDGEKFFVANGRRYSHIIDPKTCAPVEGENFSVTVVVDGSHELCATVADILSTAAVVNRKRVEEILSQQKIPGRVL